MKGEILFNSGKHIYNKSYQRDKHDELGRRKKARKQNVCCPQHRLVHYQNSNWGSKGAGGSSEHLGCGSSPGGYLLI